MSVGLELRKTVKGWRTAPKDSKIFFVLTAVAISLTTVMLATNTYRARCDGAQAFDEGRMVKVVTHKSKTINGKTIQADSTYTYKNKKE